MENNIDEKRRIQKGHDYALASLLCALIGFFIGLGLPGGIVGLILANESKKLGEDSDLLTAGKISSIIVLIISGIMIFFTCAACILMLCGVGIGILS